MTLQQQSPENQDQNENDRSDDGNGFDRKTVIVLAILAAFLVVVIMIAAMVEPYAVIGLAPLLLAIAAVVRAVGGNHRH